MLLLFFLVSTEIFASVLAVISPLIPNNVILVFILIAAIKLTLTMRLDLDSDPKAILLQIAVTMFYDTGVLLRFLSGAISRISKLKESFFCVSCGILLGYIIFKFISTVIPKLRPAKKLATWITISVIVFHTAICTVYFLRKTNLGDGSIYILRSYTFQLPELMKLEIISITFIVSELVKNNRKYLLLLYITSGFCLCTLVIVFREIGTALLIIYFTLLAAFNLSASDAEYKSKTLSFLTSKAFPLTMGTFFFVTQEVALNTNTQYHYRGFLVDDNGKFLVYNENDKRMITDEYAECLGNVLDGYNSQLGLDKVFEDKLRSPCPSDHENSYRTENGYPIGQSLELTLDADLQKSIYDYMKNHNIIGSTTILLGEGAVKVLVSYPSYNANNDLADQTLQPHACYNRCVEPAMPGSTFKILSSVVAADYGITEEYYDIGYIHEFDVSNWDVKDKKTYTTPIKRSLREAFRFSSNCWYAQLYYELGAAKVSESLDKYFSYSKPIQPDFCVLTNDINLSSNSALARAGFGQREHMSPLYTAICSNAVITGELNVPYLRVKTIDSVTWENITEFEVKESISKIPANLTLEVKNGMQDVVSDLGLTVNRQDVKLFAKTGTAEISDDKDIHYILVTGSDEANKPENTTTIVFQYLNSDKEYASGDRDHMQAILNMVYKEEKS